jgi:hypothetical protein
VAQTKEYRVTSSAQYMDMPKKYLPKIFVPMIVVTSTIKNIRMYLQIKNMRSDVRFNTFSIFQAPLSFLINWVKTRFLQRNAMERAMEGIHSPIPSTYMYATGD